MNYELVLDQLSSILILIIDQNNNIIYPKDIKNNNLLKIFVTIFQKLIIATYINNNITKQQKKYLTKTKIFIN